MRYLIICSVAIVLAACGREGADATNTIPPASTPAASQSEEKTWFIAAANPYAAEAGAAILRRGGSAVDAAVATQAVLGLVEPQSSGLGGGGFLIHYDPATDALVTYNGRETAPASATPERFLTDTGEPMNFYDAVAGGLSVGVPGAVRMLDQAHHEYGQLPWGALFGEAIALSENGFEVSPRLNSLLSRFSRVKTMDTAAAYFYDENGEPRPVGYVLKNPAYAKTLETIAVDGADAFYTGEIAAAIVEAVNTAPNPGGMTLEDIAAYRPEKVDPVCSDYRGYQICSMAPPSSGGVTTLQILTMLNGFDLAGAGAFSETALHLLFEASRLAYADRNEFLADNKQLAEEGGLTPAQVISGLLNADYLAMRAALIDSQRAAETVNAGDPSQYAASGAGAWRPMGKDASPEPPSTSHFVIVDGDGRVVSMTATVEFAFGSHLMAAGMILNNQLTDFSFLPVRDGKPVANAVGPGKRPRSSMSPVIVFDDHGDFYAALGSPGGPAIIGYVVKTLIALIDWDMPLQEAVNAPNVVYPRDQAVIEDGAIDEQIIEGLTTKGHDILLRALTSGVHAVRVRNDGTFEGAADPRREGVWLTGTVDATD